MRGIVGWGAYIPHRRLDRSAIAAIAGQGGGKGTRSVASYDEDSTTMAVEAGRAALRPLEGGPSSLWFATTSPAYLDRTNAAAVHAALRLDRSVPAYDAIGSVRSALGALRAGLDSRGDALVIASDVRYGLAGGPEEATTGDAAAALLLGDGDGAPVLADVLAWESLTEEFLDRWRSPGAATSKLWEERFGETIYTALGGEALKSALDAAGVDAVDHLVVSGQSERAVTAVVRRSGVEGVVDRLAGTVGNPAAAQPALLLASALEQAQPGQTIVLVALAGGADVILLRTTDAIASYVPARPVAAQAAGGAPVSYGRYLAWRGLIANEPPRRPEPARVSSPAAHRGVGWKFGLEAGGDADDPHMPPATTDTTRTAMADATGTVVTFTVDRLSYSPSPPVIFAVVDFDGGGRLPLELTDVDADQVDIGSRVEMTFRRLNTADGIHNYFWKARLVPGAARED